MGIYYPDGTTYDEMKDTGRQNIGHRLKTLRKGYGDKQKDVAELCEVTDSYISKVERGKSDIKASMIPLLADRYGVVAETFFHENGAIPEEIFCKLFAAADAEPYKDNILLQFNYLTDRAVERGNGKILLEMIYTMMKLCSESDNPWMDSFREIDIARGKDITSELIDEK